MSLSSTLKAISDRIAVLIQYAPLVQDTVKQVEAAMPGASGESKAQAALMIILSIAHAGEQIPVPIVQLIASMIDTAVSVFNSLGIFVKKTPPTTVTIPAAPPAAA